MTRLAGATILRIVYGLPVGDASIRYVRMARQALESITATLVPGSFLVDIFPIR